MHTLTQIFFGLQIGFLLLGAYYAWKIMRLPISPTFPYRLAIATLTLMSIWRVNLLVDFLPSIVVVIGTTIISIFWMVFFINIYTLIRDKIW